MNPAVQSLITLSRQLGAQVDLVQGGGGNISVKAEGQLYIKASGTPLKDMSAERGWVALGDAQSSQRPSMEWPMHQALTAPWVCHTHSVYLNVFSCMEDAQQRLSELLHELPHIILPYVQPGQQLAQAIQQHHNPPAVWILRNHGLLVTGETADAVAELTQLIHLRCSQLMPTLFQPANVTHQTEHLYFPDAAVLGTNLDVIAANAYIEQTILTLGGTPHPLTTAEINSLRDMEEEQYRIQLNHANVSGIGR